MLGRVKINAWLQAMRVIQVRDRRGLHQQSALTRGSLQHVEDAMHERDLLCVKSIGGMLGMAALLVAGLTAVHHLHPNHTSLPQDTSASSTIQALFPRLKQRQ